MKKFWLGFLAVMMTVAMLAASASAVTIQELQNGKAQVQSEVKALQDQLNKVVKKLTDLEDKLVETGQQIEQAEKDLAAAEKQEKQQYEDMKLRIQFMYEDGDKSMVEELLANNTIADAVTQAEYISEVHSYDRDKLDEYVATKEKIAQLKSDLETKQAKLEKTEKQFKKQQKALDSMIAEKQMVVAGLDQMIAQAYMAAVVNSYGGNGGNGGNGGGVSRGGAPANLKVPASFKGNASGYYAAIMAAAYKYKGAKYVWGGSSTKGTDCSGLVMSAYAAAGISLPHSSAAIRKMGKVVPLSEAKTGDIVWYPGHVGLYDNGQVFNAKQTGETAGYSKLKDGAVILRIGK